MNYTKILMAPVAVSIAFGAGLTTSNLVAGESTSDAKRAAEVDTLSGMIEGGVVLESDLPKVIPIVGPHGCIVVDAKGAPVEMDVSKALSTKEVVVTGRSRFDPDVVMVEAVRPYDPATATEDCSIDVEALASRYFEGVVDDEVRAAITEAEARDAGDESLHAHPHD